MPTSRPRLSSISAALAAVIIPPATAFDIPIHFSDIAAWQSGGTALQPLWSPAHPTKPPDVCYRAHAVVDPPAVRRGDRYGREEHRERRFVVRHLAGRGDGAREVKSAPRDLYLRRRGLPTA